MICNLVLYNKRDVFTGFADAGEQMRYLYEDGDFEYEIAETFQKLLPLYKQLFTYVRRKLFLRYGINVIRPDGPIPAHLTGNIWAQDWTELSAIVMPYQSAKGIDVTDELLRQGFTPLRYSLFIYYFRVAFYYILLLIFRMIQMAEEFYTSLGLKPMPPEFWRHSMFEKPNDRKVQCTASAWDFCNRIDYR